jgi:hypothetical protein
MSTTTTSDGGINTPTESSLRDDLVRILALSAALRDRSADRSWNCPWPDRTYIIRDPTTKLVIGLRKGHLCLVSEGDGHGRSIYWSFYQSSRRLFRFQNEVSGTFIGTRKKLSKWTIVAEAKVHSISESVCVLEHPDGGHAILVGRDADGFSPISVGEGPKLVISSSLDEATTWEFIRVEPN